MYEAEIRKSLLSDITLQPFGEVFRLEARFDHLKEVRFEFNPQTVIFPVREGELIEDLQRIPNGVGYSVSYPGTAATKCVVLFQAGFNVFIGGVPSYEYTRITLSKVDAETFHLVFLSKEHHYYIIPFGDRWQEAADQYRALVGIAANTAVKRTPKFFLQIGIKDSYGHSHIRDFQELLPAVETFHRHFGDEHLVHFFGTNAAGYDRMFPDYTIDPELGGETSFKNLLKETNRLNLRTSHHYNPRIADSNWIKQNPEYENAIVRRNGQEVVEPYKEHPHFVMNPNDKRWFDRCFQTIDYLTALGLDYLEIDQFTYQRNFYHPEKALAIGYKEMVDRFIEKGIKFWLEGVSDVFRLPEGNFYQILIRDRAQLWDDGENRRGYPYGRTFAEFFMYLYPDSEVSYQVVTEHKLFHLIPERLPQAQRLNAAIYDIELGFYDEAYMNNLHRIIEIIEEHES